MLRNFCSNALVTLLGILATYLISASVSADIYDAGGVGPSYTSATAISDTANQWHNRVSTTDAYNVTDPDLTVSIASSTSVSPYSLTFSSSAATSSFVASDVYVTGGTLSSFSGSGSSFSATVTESSSGAAVSIIIPASAFQDNAGNNNTQASLFGNYSDTLNAGTDVSKTFGDASYTQAASGGSGTGAVTYASSAASVATVNSSTGAVTIVGVGSATITATRAADANYNAVSDDYVLTVSKATDTLNAGTDVSKTFGDASYTQAASGGSGTGAVTYASSAASVATVNSSTGAVTIVGVGSATITATRAADANYNAVSDDYVLTVSKATDTLNAGTDVSKTFGDASYTQAASGGSGTGAVTYASSAASVATVNSSTGAVTIVGVGSATITATRAADANYNAVSDDYVLTVSKATDTLNAGTDVSKTFGDASYTQAASGGSGTGAVTYASSAASVATVNSSTGAVTIVGVGSATITATRAADANYNAVSDDYVLTVSKATDTLNAGTDVSKTFGDASYTQAASGGSGTGAVTYASSAASVATVNSSTGAVTIVGVGSATITATRAADANYNAVSDDYVLTVSKATDTLNAGTDVSKTFGDASYTQAASGGSGTGAVTYASSAASVATVNSSTGAVTIVGVGSATITATRAADANYNAVSDDYVLTVSKATDTLNAGTDVSKTFGDASYTQAASGGSGTGAVTYASSAASVATVNSSTGAVTIVGVGSATITATRAADANYNAVSDDYVLTVSKATDTLNAGTDVSKTFGDASYTQAASGGSGTGAVTYASSAASVATVNSSTGAVTIVGVGSATITATRAADANYNAVSDDYVLTVSKATDTLNAGTDVSKTFGDASYTQAASGGSGTGAVTYASSAASVATVNSSTGAVTIVGVGSATITATRAADANYNAVSDSYALSVNAKALTVTADGITKTKGTSDPALTYSITTGSLETGDSFTGELGRAPGEDVGTYAIALGTLTAGTNYTVTFVAAVFTIVENPTMVISADVSNNDVTTDRGISVTFVSSETTNDFNKSDVTVTNGSLSAFSGSGTTYSATFTAFADGATIIKINNAVYTGTSTGLDNVASDIFNWTSTYDAYLEVIEDITGNSNAQAATDIQINSLDGVSGARVGIDYTTRFNEASYGNSTAPTAAEIQGVVDYVSLLVDIGYEADNSGTGLDFTTDQLTTNLGLSDVTVDYQSEYNSYIDDNADQFSAPATFAEVQSMVHIVNVVEAAGLVSLTSPQLVLAGVNVNPSTDPVNTLSAAELAQISSDINAANPVTTADLHGIAELVVTPVISLNGSATMSIERGTNYIEPGASAADAQDSVTNPTVSVGGDVVDTSSVGVYTVTYSAIDAAGNAATQVTRTVNVVDTTAPVITVMTGTDTVERGSAWTDAGATTTEGTISTSGSVNTAVAGTYTITYSAIDAAGNAATQVTRTVNVVDTTAPVITVTGDNPATVEQGATYSDVGATADGGESVTSSGTVDTSTVGAYTITYSAIDVAGNAGTATRAVNVVDTTEPVITLTGDSSVTAELGENYTDQGASAVDNNDGDISAFIATTNPVNTQAVGSYTVTYNVSDAAGNAATPVTRTVIVADTVAPVITLLGDAELTLEVGDTFTDAGATATDTVDGNLSDDIVVTGSVDTTSVGTYTLTYNVSDAAGNAATPVTRIVIVADTVAPVITLLGDAELTLEVGDTFTDAGATATDTVDGNLSDDIVVTGSVDTTSVGTYTLTYNVSDAAGNAATPVTRTVIVADTVAPIITLLGDAELTLEVGDTFTDAGATATDTVDGNLSDDIVVTGSVDTTSVGTYTLTYNVSDAAGNAATPVTRTVIVADTVAPVITLLGDAELTLEVGDTFTDAGATATDTVDGNLSDDIVVTGSVDTTSVGTYTLTYNVSDAAGNAATPVTRIVIVADTVAPVITLLGDAELTLEVGDTFTDAGATATDTVDGNLSDDIVVTGSVDTTSVGTYTLTYNVSDAAGNAATPVTRTVVVNEIPITIIVPNDITVNAVGYLTAVDFDPQDISFAVDGDGNTLAITPDQFGLFQSGTYEIIWSATNGISTVTETQILKVVPLVNLGTPITTTEGNNLTIDVILSGNAADYPVSVPFTISGTAMKGEDYTVDPSGMVTISDGTQGLISLSIITDDIAESEESVVITIGEPLNASLGVLHEQIVTIAEENLAPKTALMVSQGDVIGTTVTKDQGLVTVTADIDDANADDVHTINWASALNDIPNASVDPETQALIFDPADLDVGVTELAAEVSDGTNIVSVYVVVNIIDQAPVLSDQADSDGDGLTDADEGAGDIDGDNIPDYQDSISHPNVIAADFGVLQSEPGTIITLGARALAAGRNVVSLLNKGAIGAPLLEADPAYEFANNLIDFELNGAEFGYSYRLVVPLEFELNEGAVYRKYVNDIIGWQDFIYDANNDILSTFAVDGACPAPGSDVYTPGLKAGHNCIELVIEEGGPNDADGIVNGNLVDPGGVADKYIGTPSELSEVRLRTYKMLANGVDTTVITVTAYDADGVWLDHMSVSASSLLPGAQISEFTAQGNGVYTAILTAGNKVSNGPVTVVIDNGKVSVSLRSARLRLETPGIDKPLSSGGCTVATNGSTDASLLLLLIMSGLLLVRRRYRHNI